MSTVSKAKTIEDITNKISTASYAARPLHEWRVNLADECQVYVLGENYLAKRFDAINYKFCDKNEAKDILVDNLYALLRYKYFPTSSEEIDKRIDQIVSMFTTNLKTSLKKVSFDKFSDSNIISFLPDGCVAFRNGVYNFFKDRWLFKYDIIRLDRLKNVIYSYDPQYCITWYFDYDFEPLPINVVDTPILEFISLMKEMTKDKNTKNLCFELMYNISHDANDIFSIDMFNHFCEVLGYTLLQSFSEHFVFLIGSGQNGKNSLFDGCLTNRLVPKSASVSMDDIEENQFVTGTLENKAHNIYLETDPKVHTKSQVLKEITGSLYHSVERKGIQPYSSIINCKFIFAGNDKDNIKFSDTTVGFMRRINMFEIFYRYDKEKKFLKLGDYYDTQFSDSLKELKDDLSNTTAYIYFGMYGILSATKNLSRNFDFNRNDFNESHTDIDFDFKEAIKRISPVKIGEFLCRHTSNEYKYSLFDENSKRLYDSPILAQLGYHGWDDFLELLDKKENYMPFFSEHSFYISVNFLQRLVKDEDNGNTFTAKLKKTFNINKLFRLYNNKAYVKASFEGDKLKF